jgi:hypothetical protein
MAGQKALRLTFSFKDGVVQLASTTGVDMVVPPDDAPAKAPEQGFWAELRDPSNRTLFRRVLHNPIPVDREVFSEDHGKTLSRAPGAPSQGMFTVVVPNHADATALALFSSHHEAAQTPAVPPAGISHALPFHAVRAVSTRLDAAREIARFDLKPGKP